MNYAPLALGFVFVAVAIMFRSNAAKAKDHGAARNARFASTMFFIAGAAFFVAAAISMFGD